MSGVDGLTAAQATLRFSLDQGVSVVPGATELWHIKENQSTPLDVAAPKLAPLEDGPIGVSMTVVHPQWKTYVQLGGGGSVKNGEDGHLYADTLSLEEAKVVQKSVQISSSCELSARSQPEVLRALVGQPAWSESL